MVKKFDLYNTPPEENEDELDLEGESSQFLPEANDDTQLEYTPEQPLIETELEDDSQPPPTAQERYANVLKQAAAAGPRASDYRGVALGKLSSALGAGMGGYMESMAGTMFHKPDFSWMDEGRKEAGDLGAYNIKAKEAEKKRLVDEAAGIRQEALLPGEMAAQEAKSQEIQARLEALKPAPEEYRKTAEQQLGFPIPPGTNKKKIDDLLIEKGVSKSRVQSEKPVSDTYRKMVAKQLSRIMEEDVDLTGMSSNEIRDFASIAKYGRITPEEEARIKAAIERNDLRKQALEGTQARAENKEQRQERELEVPGYGKALTPGDARIAKTKISAQKKLTAGISEMQKAYKNIKANGLLNPNNIQKLKELGNEGQSLVMQFKDYYGLGAPQAAELKFLFGLTASNPEEMGKAILSDRFLGTSVEDKLENLKRILERDMKTELTLRMQKGDLSDTQPQQPPDGEKKETEEEMFERLDKKYGGKK